jgi:hypothetical protein
MPFGASQHAGADQLGLWLEDLRRRKLLSINRPLPRAQLWWLRSSVVRKNRLGRARRSG